MPTENLSTRHATIAVDVRAGDAFARLLWACVLVCTGGSRPVARLPRFSRIVI